MRKRSGTSADTPPWQLPSCSTPGGGPVPVADGPGLALLGLTCRGQQLCLAQSSVSSKHLQTPSLGCALEAQQGVIPSSLWEVWKWVLEYSICLQGQVLNGYTGDNITDE